MIENRLELNKRPKYELPDEAIIIDYRRSLNLEFNFIPDLCMGCYGVGCVGKFYKPKQIAKQFWIKSENTQLIEFIKNYNWRNRILTSTNKSLSLNEFKKIILEEFYGVKNDRK